MKNLRLLLLSILISAPAAAEPFVAVIESDNGTPYKILQTSPALGTGAEAIVRSPDGPLEMVYDCRGKLIVVHIQTGRRDDMDYIPPRSVAGRIGQIACARSGKRMSSE